MPHVVKGSHRQLCHKFLLPTWCHTCCSPVQISFHLRAFQRWLLHSRHPIRKVKKLHAVSTFINLWCIFSHVNTPKYPFRTVTGLAGRKLLLMFSHESVKFTPDSGSRFHQLYCRSCHVTTHRFDGTVLKFCLSVWHTLYLNHMYLCVFWWIKSSVFLNKRQYYRPYWSTMGKSHCMNLHSLLMFSLLEIHCRPVRDLQLYVCF